MKKKKILKTFKKLFKNQYIDAVHKIGATPAKNHYREMMFSEPDELTNNRCRNLIFRLLKIRDNINLDINDSVVSIHINIYDLKKSKKSIKSTPTLNNTKTANHLEYLSIEVIKDVGCILSSEHTKVYFKDKLLYTDVINEVKKTSDLINRENFDTLYEFAMTTTGLARESNLDDILSD
jgi:hypothetical protein